MVFVRFYLNFKKGDDFFYLSFDDDQRQGLYMLLSYRDALFVILNTFKNNKNNNSPAYTQLDFPEVKQTLVHNWKVFLIFNLGFLACLSKVLC